MREDVRQLVLTVRGEDGHAAGSRPWEASQVRAAAKLMSLFENEPQRLPELFVAAKDTPEPRLTLGITGSPGSGKSTLTDALVAEARAAHPLRNVGVIAVDPSSPFSGGAVLGDRVRMMRHATDPRVFVRSLATRGHLGGLTLGVKAVCRVMGLLCCDLVIIETVGVGQSEVEVTRVADHVLVVLAPGQGDGIQMLKAGLMEIADSFVVNKADHPGAEAMHAQLLASLQLTSRSDTDIHLVSATDKTGVPGLYARLEALTAERGRRWQQQRQRRLSSEVREAILEEARRLIDHHLGTNGTFEPKLCRLLAGDATIDQLARDLIARTANGETS